MNKKAQTNEMKYLLLAFMLLFAVGTVNFFTSSFIDITPENYDGYLSPLVNFVSEGYNFNLEVPIPILPDLDLDFTFNPFGMLGGDVQNFLTSQTLGFALLPSWLAIPLIIIISGCFIYFVIKIVQGFIP